MKTIDGYDWIHPNQNYLNGQMQKINASNVKLN